MREIKIKGGLQVRRGAADGIQFVHVSLFN